MNTPETATVPGVSDNNRVNSYSALELKEHRLDNPEVMDVFVERLVRITALKPVHDGISAAVKLFPLNKDDLKAELSLLLSLHPECTVSTSASINKPYSNSTCFQLAVTPRNSYTLSDADEEFRDPTEATEIDFGRFNLTMSLSLTNNIDTHRLRMYYGLSVKPLSPIYSLRQGSTRVSHPHVHDGTLCLGEGGNAFKIAVHEYRFSDAVDILISILNTYNPISAYSKLVFWSPTVVCIGCALTIKKKNAIKANCCGSIHNCTLCMSTKCGNCSSAIHKPKVCGHANIVCIGCDKENVCLSCAALVIDGSTYKVCSACCTTCLSCGKRGVGHKAAQSNKARSVPGARNYFISEDGYCRACIVECFTCGKTHFRKSPDIVSVTRRSDGLCYHLCKGCSATCVACGAVTPDSYVKAYDGCCESCVVCCYKCGKTTAATKQLRCSSHSHCLDCVAKYVFVDELPSTFKFSAPEQEIVGRLSQRV